MKPGRNDPCPCGSGRKYKHCCLNKTDVVPETEARWRRVRRALDPLSAGLLKEARLLLTEDDLDDAWEDFQLDEECEPFDPENYLAPFFLSWMLHDWQPDRSDVAQGDAETPKSVARSYLARAGHRLDPIARRYLEACLATPFSFHEVIECRPGQGLRLRDVMLGTEVDVTERTASRSLQVGDCVFGKVVPIEGLVLLEGLGPTAIAPADKPILIELRRTLGTRDTLFGIDTLREFADELRAAYLDILEISRAEPELRNTDGDVLEFHTLSFDVDSPDEALARLQDLGAGLVEPVIARDDAGRLLRADITWARAGNHVHDDWDNTTLGTVRIEGTRLTAEVNSAKRATAVRKLIEDRLGVSVRYRLSAVQSIESLMADGRDASELQETEHDAAELAALPEMQAAMTEYLRAYYRRWLDAKLPALGNRSPRKAVRDADGREAVAALVRQIERHGASMDPPLDPGIVSELRATLGLD
jgi:hypothetical protein